MTTVRDRHEAGSPADVAAAGAEATNAEVHAEAPNRELHGERRLRADEKAHQLHADDTAGESPVVIVRRTGTPEWILRVFVECFLVVLSILLALGVDSWRQEADNRALARKSLEIFEREIRQNAERMADVVPYHIGLRDVVEGMAADPERVVEVRSIVEGLEPTFVLNAAWETALATGALRHIDVQTVSALSLTYSLQQRFREESRAGLPRLLVTAATTEEERLAQIQQAHAYLTSIIRSEQELHGVFLQAIRQIEVGLGRRETIDDTASDSTAQ